MGGMEGLFDGGACGGGEAARGAASIEIPDGIFDMGCALDIPLRGSICAAAREEFLSYRMAKPYIDFAEGKNIELR